MKYNQVVLCLAETLTKFLFHGKESLIINVSNAEGILTPQEFKLFSVEGIIIIKIFKNF